MAVVTRAEYEAAVAEWRASGLGVVEETKYGTSMIGTMKATFMREEESAVAQFTALAMRAGWCNVSFTCSPREVAAFASIGRTCDAADAEREAAERRAMYELLKREFEKTPQTPQCDTGDLP